LSDVVTILRTYGVAEVIPPRFFSSSKLRNFNDEELHIVSKRGLAAARTLAEQETSPQPDASI
jgi:hypothetical protein